MFYLREANYHETDQMGVIHHSNYIKWMEEARISALEQLGISYKKLEEKNIYSPVLELDIKYLKPVKFGDKIKIYVKIETYTGVKLALSYEMKNELDEVVVLAHSYHCFIMEGKIISLKKINHPYHALLACNDGKI